MVTKQAVWHLAAPGLNSYEDILQGQGMLTVNVSDNCDGRWGDKLTLGPLVTDITTSGAFAAHGGAAGTQATVNGMCFSESMESTEYLFAIGGNKLIIIQLSNRTLTADGGMEGDAGAVWSEAATDILFTKQGTTEEVSVFFDNIPYRVITATNGASITASENNGADIVRHARLMGSDAAVGRVGLVGRVGSTSTAMNTVTQNLLSGSVTMDANSPTTLATISGPPIIFTGLALDGRFWLIGTSDGPYYLDVDGARFRPLIEEIDNQLSSPTNGFGMRQSSFFGTVIPLERSVRISNNLEGLSIGPETFPRNDGPVRGRLGMGTGSELWDYWPFYNGTDTYICAVRPRQPSDLAPDGLPVVYYPIIKLASAESKYALYAGRRGGVTSRTVYIGNGNNVSWFLEPSTLRAPDDSNMTYASSGSVFGTELRRNPDKLKRIKNVALKTRNCTSTETVAVDVVWYDHREVAHTDRFGGVISTNGYHVLNAPTRSGGAGIEARSFYVKLTLSRGGTTTLSPYVMNRGEVIVEYDE